MGGNITPHSLSVAEQNDFLPKSREWKGREKNQLVVEKHDKHDLRQVIKVHINSGQPYGQHAPLI